MRHHLHTEIHIEAPPAVVWEVLTDLERFAEWNPFIVSSNGTAEVGETLTNRLLSPGGKAITFRPTVTVVEPGKTFEWLGRLGVPGIFDGRHRFELEPTETGTTLRHSEQLSGLLVRPMRRRLDDQTVGGFEAMNEALRERAEARVRSTA